jgi:upstream activation factor subunit UAF30
MVRTTKAAAMPFTRAPTNTNSNTSATPVPTKLPVEAAPVAKKSKTTATTTAATAAATTAATPAPVVAPIVATPTPASAPVVAVAEASATTIAVVVENVSIAALTAELNKINAQILALVNESKVLTKKIEKQNAKDIKAAAKSKPVRKVNANRQPSGFVKPTIISDELAAFLGRASGTLMSRTEVSKAINEYIKNNNLQLQSNKQHITPDAKLKTLLSIGPDDQLTYFNLQRYLKNHFQKSIADVATATTTTVAAAAR